MTLRGATDAKQRSYGRKTNRSPLHQGIDKDGETNWLHNCFDTNYLGYKPSTSY